MIDRCPVPATAMTPDDRRMITVAEIVVALAGGVAVWWVARSELRSSWAAALAGLATAGALFWLPAQLHGALADARSYHRIGRAEADNAGALANGLDPANYTRIRALVPPDAKLYITGDGRFRFWAYTDLLPRLAVDSPEDAQWVLTRKPTIDIPGVRIARVYRLHGATLGRIAS